MNLKDKDCEEMGHSILYLGIQHAPHLVCSTPAWHPQGDWRVCAFTGQHLYEVSWNPFWYQGCGLGKPRSICARGLKWLNGWQQEGRQGALTTWSRGHHWLWWGVTKRDRALHCKENRSQGQESFCSRILEIIFSPRSAKKVCLQALSPSPSR